MTALIGLGVASLKAVKVLDSEVASMCFKRPILVVSAGLDLFCYLLPLTDVGCGPQLSWKGCWS